MNRNTLADRYLNYCDAVTAFAFVQTVAFSVALADPDSRCSIGEIWQFVAGGIFLVTVVLTAGIIYIRKVEMSLRDVDSMDTDVTKHLARIQRWRFAIIWVTFGVLLLSVLAAGGDPQCG